MVSALAPSSLVVVVGLGVGTMVACVPYYCAAVWCLSLSFLLLLLWLCLSMFAWTCWCALSSKRPGARSRGRDASHWRQHCGASIEDRAYCGVKLHLAACRSWIGRWDDGGLGGLLLLRCSVLFVVAVLVAAAVFFLLVYLCLPARVGVLGHRRGTALGHPCGMPPTGANIAVLLLKTWLAPDSTYT